ncbi:MAG: carboxypeptidase regulatory-like domain-containing protein [Planctomycetes bacterium]|nr:carboxypeptidase regulatory-like domain-containing protein [Planctomycetota bacterium]
MRALTTAALVAALAGLTGCGGGTKFAAVSGRVTLNDQPLEGVSVDFQPTATTKEPVGSGSTGITDRDGRYTLRSQLDKSQAGAVVGKHQVRIWAPEGSQDRDAESKAKGKKGDRPFIPGRYHVNSELTFDVPADGTDKADFALKSP